jgi:hypothetical protein
VSDLSHYPHILDFSPKTRELVRAITERGEVLTGSSRSLDIDQSKTTTDKNETTVGLEAGYEAGGLKATGKIEHKWGTTREDKRGLSIESGSTSERNQIHTTSMDQLYSLLTGYHSGTNRASFILLARPGTLQATNRRTFAPGLRMLEGVQDFIFIVARPADQDGLCIEAALNTGHYSEGVRLLPEEDPTERRTFTFTVRARAKGGSEGFFSFQGQTIEFGSAERPQDTFTLPSDGGGEWIIDVDAPGTEQGIARGADRTRTEPPAAGAVANEYDLRVIRADDRTVRAIGRVTARGGYDFSSGPDTIVDADFIIHVRRPLADAVMPSADPSSLLVTHRGLSVCYRAEDGCPVVIEPSTPPQIDLPVQWMEGLEHVNLNSQSSIDQTYAALRSALIAGATAAARGIPARRFVETDYFSRRVAEQMPRSLAQLAVGQIINVQEYGGAGKLMSQMPVGQFLRLNASQLARRSGMKMDEALRLRRAVLRYIEQSLNKPIG